MSRVVTALAPGWESSMVQVIDALPGVVVERRCVDLPDLLAAVTAGHGQIALVGGDLRGLDREALAILGRSGASVVGATPTGDEAMERRLRQLGLTTVIHPGSPVESLLEALSLSAPDGGSVITGSAGAAAPGGHPGPGGVDRSAVPEPGDVSPTGPAPDLPAEEGDGSAATSRVVAVWGPTGAPGRTMVAVNLAQEAALAGLATVLVDLDTYGASVAQTLALVDEAPGVAAAARSAELGVLDLGALARVAPIVGPGFRVITGIPTAARWTEVRGAAVERILELARGLGELVVVDCGFCLEDDEDLSYDTLAPRRNETTLTALAAADAVLAVGSADPVGLQRLVRGVQALALCAAPEPLIVINRVRAGAVGSDPQRRIADSVERFAGVRPAAFLPEDRAVCDSALLAGRTLAESAPNSPLRSAIAQLPALVHPAAVSRPRSTRRGVRGPRQQPGVASAR